MIDLFIDPYDNELVSSFYARYHYYSGNSNTFDTFQELLGDGKMTQFKFFPSRLKFFEDNVGNKKYTAEYIIRNHTAFPFYSVFVSKQKQDCLINFMKERGSDKVDVILRSSERKYYSASKFKYCPLCIEEEVEKYGEAYFNRLHQIDRLLICPKHKCKLVEYIEQYKYNKEFLRLEYENILINYRESYFDDSVNAQIVKLAESIQYIMNLEYLKFNKEYVLNELFIYLEKKGYLTRSSKVRREKLAKDIMNYYGTKLLVILNINGENELYRIIINILNKNKQTINPINTILIILFLCDNITDFFTYHKKVDEFGIGPWPCLNPICQYYKKDIIYSVDIKKLKKSRKKYGIFKCNRCGYTYRRNGPDPNGDNKCKKGKIIDFGEVWMDEFNKAIVRDESMCSISKRFDIYRQFIVYYKKNGKIISRNNISKCNYTDERFLEYSSIVKEYINKNPNMTKGNIMKNLSKEISWLRKYSPEWLKDNLPQNQKGNGNMRIDYDKVDEEIYNKLQDEYLRFIKEKPERRITITLLERIVKRKFSRILNKLHKSKAFVESVTENIEDYSSRVIRNYCDQLVEKNIYMSKAQIIRNTNRRYLVNRNSDYEKKLMIYYRIIIQK